MDFSNDYFKTEVREDFERFIKISKQALPAGFPA